MSADPRQRIPVSSCLDSLSSSERNRIDQLSASVAASLADWAAGYPLVRQVRIRPLSLSVCASAPFSRVEALVAVARVSLWVFTVDDVFDEEIKLADELESLIDLYGAIADDGWSGPVDDELAWALKDVVHDLQRFPLFDRLAPVWSRAFRRTLDGMSAENGWRTAARNDATLAPPSYRHHLTPA